MTKDSSLPFAPGTLSSTAVHFNSPPSLPPSSSSFTHSLHPNNNSSLISPSFSSSSSALIPPSSSSFSHSTSSSSSSRLPPFSHSPSTSSSSSSLPLSREHNYLRFNKQPPFRNMTLVNSSSFRQQPQPPNSNYHHQQQQQQEQQHLQPPPTHPPLPQQYNPSGIYPGITALPLHPQQRHPPTQPQRQTSTDLKHPPHVGHVAIFPSLSTVSQPTPLPLHSTPATTPNRFSNDGSFLAQFLENQKKSKSSNTSPSGNEKDDPKTAGDQPSTKKSAEPELNSPVTGKNTAQQSLANKKILSRPTGFKKVSRSSTPAGAFNGSLKRPATDSSDHPSQSTRTDAFDLSAANKKSKSASASEAEINAEKYHPGEIADDVKETIEKAAEFVSRHGASFLGILKEKNKTNPKFNFLFDETTSEHQFFKQRLDEKDAEMNLIAKQELQRDVSVAVPSASSTLTKPTGVHYRPPLPEPVDAVSSHQLEVLTRSSVGITSSASKSLGITFSMSVKDAMAKPMFSSSNSSTIEPCESGSNPASGCTKKKSRWGQMNPASTLELPAAAGQSWGASSISGQTGTNHSHANVNANANIKLSSSSSSSEEMRKPQPVYSKYFDAYSPGMIQVGKRWAWPEDEMGDEKDGTYEHIKRKREMEETARIANLLTAAADNSRAHHIGQYLPKQELERFEASVNAARATKLGGDTSDFPQQHEDHAESKLDATNLGYRMLKNAGWEEGSGLGRDGSGIANPVNRELNVPTRKDLVKSLLKK